MAEEDPDKDRGWDPVEPFEDYVEVCILHCYVLHKDHVLHHISCFQGSYRLVTQGGTIQEHVEHGGHGTEDDDDEEQVRLHWMMGTCCQGCLTIDGVFLTPFCLTCLVLFCLCMEKLPIARTSNGRLSPHMADMIAKRFLALRQLNTTNFPLDGHFQAIIKEITNGSSGRLRAITLYEKDRSGMGEGLARQIKQSGDGVLKADYRSYHEAKSQVSGKMVLLMLFSR